MRAVFLAPAALALVSVFAASPVAAATLEQLRARYAAQISQYDAARDELDKARKDLSDLSDWYYLDNCAKTDGTAGPKCREVERRMQADQARIRDLQRQVNRLKIALKDYLAAKAVDDLAAALRGQVTEAAGTDDLTHALQCLQASSLASRDLSALYSESLALLEHHDPDAAFAWLRKTPGYRDRMCGSPEPSLECWENVGGSIAYRTKGQLRIDANCIVHRGDWSHFPADPAEYVRMADSATIHGPSCLDGLDRDEARHFREFLKASPMTRIRCDRNAGANPNECAHTSHGDHELVFVRPNDCGRMDNSIFHEFLHAGTGLDDMTARHHNNPECRPYDAIYACSELCFPTESSLKKAGISWYGCHACARDDGAADRRCSSLPAEFDNAFESCRPRDL